MINAKATFSGFSVDDLAAAKEFYINKLGLELASEEMGLDISLTQGGRVFIYQKDDHQPATFTVLNFVVEDIDKSIDELSAQGVSFERYDDLGDGIEQDEKGVLRGLAANMGPDIAWFKDSAGNILAVLQDK